jgi:hypothetical protein
MHDRRGFFLFLALLVLSGCASEPEKFYDGPTQPAKDTATIVSQSEFVLHVDGQRVPGSASVLPGRHRIVVNNSNTNIKGHVELDARAGRVYTARTIRAKDGVHTWAVDLETCAVVAGTQPWPMPTAEEKMPTAEEKMSPGEAAAEAFLVSLGVVSLFTTGQTLDLRAFRPDPEECAGR